MEDSTFPLDLFPIVKTKDRTKQLEDLLNIHFEKRISLAPIMSVIDTSEPLRLFLFGLYNRIIELEKKTAGL